MTDQERIQQIKEFFEESRIDRINAEGWYEISADDADWIIEKVIDTNLLLEDHLQLELKQAKKIKELEDHIEMYKKNEDYLLVRLKRSDQLMRRDGNGSTARLTD